MIAGVPGQHVGDDVVPVVEGEGVLKRCGDVRTQRGVGLHRFQVCRLDGVGRTGALASSPPPLHDLHQPAAEHLQQEGLIRAISECPVYQVHICELESQCPERQSKQICSELRGERSDDSRRLREVAERSVAREPGEPLYGVQPSEYDLHPAGVSSQSPLSRLV